jgi:glycine cleavage system regulatory protein
MSRIYEELLNLNNIINQITQLFKWTQIQIDNLSKKAWNMGQGSRDAAPVQQTQRELYEIKIKMR